MNDAIVGGLAMIAYASYFYYHDRPRDWHRGETITPFRIAVFGAAWVAYGLTEFLW